MVCVCSGFPSKTTYCLKQLILFVVLCAPGTGQTLIMQVARCLAAATEGAARQGAHWRPALSSSEQKCQCPSG